MYNRLRNLLVKKSFEVQSGIGSVHIDIRKIRREKWIIRQIRSLFKQDWDRGLIVLLGIAILGREMVLYITFDLNF